eukprot:scaffold68847_cov68-Phaeocystis_antarctica.AAC.1
MNLLKCKAVPQNIDDPVTVQRTQPQRCRLPRQSSNDTFLTQRETPDNAGAPCSALHYGFTDYLEPATLCVNCRTGARLWRAAGPARAPPPPPAPRARWAPYRPPPPPPPPTAPQSRSPRSHCAPDEKVRSHCL